MRKGRYIISVLRFHIKIGSWVWIYKFFFLQSCRVSLFIASLCVSVPFITLIYSMERIFVRLSPYIIIVLVFNWLLLYFKLQAKFCEMETSISTIKAFTIRIRLICQDNCIISGEW